jgi:LCP family protein required for cell wall assembly
VADQPTSSGTGDGPPAGDRPAGSTRSAGGRPEAPLTVAELLARSGTSGVPRRRAERRESADATGRQPAVRDDGVPGSARPPLRGGVRRAPVSSPGVAAPPVLPTGWQPAMPDGSADQPAARVRPADEPAMPGGSADQPAARVRPAAPLPSPGSSLPRRPAQAQAPGQLLVPPPASGPTPVSGPTAVSGSTPAVNSPADPAPAAPREVPPRPVMRAVPADAPPASVLPGAAPAARPAVVAVPRVVPPVSVTPAPPPAGPASSPVGPASSPVGSAPLAPLPYASAPVPGVRRSLPLPPIPGRDLPADAAPADPAAGRAPASPARRRLTRAALALVALLGLVAAYYVGLYFYADRSIDRVDALVTDGPEILAPQLQEGSQTYLVVGTGLPGRSGPSAVSTMIAHVSDDGGQAVLVSVPPTALNDTPTCRNASGDVRAAVTEPFAAALLDGGPSCLVRSVQQLTGLRVDHYLAVDLTQLPGMVDALGDVPVCLPRPAAESGAALELPAGDNRLTGADVTGFLQGTGSDVTGAAAAQREQVVLTSTLGTALSGGTLADPLTLTRFLSRAGDAFTVDADSTLGDVRALGATLRDLSGDAVERSEVPVAQVGHVPAGSDQAVVVVDATATRELFDAVIDGGRLPVAAVTEDPAAVAAGGTGSGAAADTLPDPAPTDPAPTDPAPTDPAQPDPTQTDLAQSGPVPPGTTVSVDPAGVTLDVLDATGGERTAEVADALAAAGFRIGLRGAEPAAVDRTVVRYGPAALEPARTVAAAVPGSVLIETDEVGGAVQLVIGPDFAGLAPVGLGTPVPTTAAPAPVETGTGADCS